jgi:hypothetical protein
MRNISSSQTFCAEMQQALKITKLLARYAVTFLREQLFEIELSGGLAGEFVCSAHRTRRLEWTHHRRLNNS